MNLLKNKKHTEIRKETAPLKMKRGQKKLFALYAVMVLSICIGATCVYAAGDPLTVVNNLSTFIFCKRDPGPDHGIGEESRRGAMRNAGSLLTFEDGR